MLYMLVLQAKFIEPGGRHPHRDTFQDHSSWPPVYLLSIFDNKFSALVDPGSNTPGTKPAF